MVYPTSNNQTHCHLCSLAPLQDPPILVPSWLPQITQTSRCTPIDQCILIKRIKEETLRTTLHELDQTYVTGLPNADDDPHLKILHKEEVEEVEVDTIRLPLLKPPKMNACTNFSKACEATTLKEYCPKYIWATEPTHGVSFSPLTTTRS